MSNRLGMDAGLVRGYADQMDVLADSLGSIVASVNASVGQLASTWLGADAHELSQRWQYHDREAVAVLATHIRDLATIARTNAAEQDQASGAGVTADASGVGVGVLPGAFDFGRRVLDGVNDRLTLPEQLVGLPGDIRHWDYLFGTPEQRLLSEDGSIRHFVTSTFFTDSKRFEHLVDGAAADKSAILTHLHVTSGLVKGVGVAGAALAVGTKTADAFHDAQQGDAWGVGNDVSDAASTALKAGGPTAYLGGVVLSEWTDVANAARQIDWSTPPPVPTWNNLTTLYAPAFADSVKQLPGHIWKWVT